MLMKIVKSSFCLAFFCGTSLTTSAQELLVGNTRADNIVSVDSGVEITEFIGGVPNPDHIITYQGDLYISAGDNANNSAIYTYVDDTLSMFASGGSLMRPYGFAFDGGILYVASFMSDQILTYDASTGEYIGVFAETDGTAEGLCNGPNHIAIYEGMLYLTTQGSNVINGTLTYLFSSQIVKYDLATGVGEVFASPEAMPGGLGFVSMLGCQVYCGMDDCTLVTTDFAGGFRVYSLDGTLMYSAETTYTAGAATGALAIDEEAEVVYIPGFVNETIPGVVMRLDLATGAPLPGEGFEGTPLYVEDAALVRPIGILFVAPPPPPPAALLVGNTRADNIVSVDSGVEITEFIDGVPNPDHIITYQGDLYISAGDNANNSAIYTYVDDTLSMFASGGSLMRPYGFAFDGGILYVASFMSDQILTYDASTGEYIGVFAETDGTAEGLCNGPNHIAIYEGMLYLTTQGSNVINGTLTYLFSSQIVKYDLATGVGEVFASPEAMPGGLGFVSMLGCQVYCGMDDCTLVTTDFAGGFRVYSLDGTLMYSAETTYTAGAATGALAIDEEAEVVYIPGFVNETIPGVVMRLDLATGAPLPGEGFEGTPLYVEDAALVRPIGIMIMSEVVSSPPTTVPTTAPIMTMTSPPTMAPSMTMTPPPTTAPSDSSPTSGAFKSVFGTLNAVFLVIFTLFL